MWKKWRLRAIFLTNQASNISTPILTLAETAKVISEQKDYSVRAVKSGKDEVGLLTDAFNQMLSQIQSQNQTLSEFNQKLEQRIRERTAELESANKEMESFSYSISHDLRAPIRAISGFTKIIEKKYNGTFDEEGKELFNAITNEAGRMGTLIDDLLDFSRLGRKEIEKSKTNMTVLANEAVSEVLKSEGGKYLPAGQAGKPKITVNDLPTVLCDPALIRQVFINLFSNALKYSHKKSDPAIEIGSYTENNFNIYYVKDNGVGFDMKYYNKLFGVFQRLHSMEEYEGTGIGLAIIKRTIIRHGGNVWAEAKLNEGAVFYFSLPIKTHNNN